MCEAGGRRWAGEVRARNQHKLREIVASATCAATRHERLSPLATVRINIHGNSLTAIILCDIFNLLLYVLFNIITYIVLKYIVF